MPAFCVFGRTHRVTEMIKPSELRQGKTIYIVWARGADSTMAAARVMSRPMRGRAHDWDVMTFGLPRERELFCLCRLWVDQPVGCPTPFWLKDVGIGQPNVKGHRAFFSRRRALTYLRQCQTLGYGRPPQSRIMRWQSSDWSPAYPQQAEGRVKRDRNGEVWQ
jgi:hypothetical protein